MEISPGLVPAAMLMSLAISKFLAKLVTITISALAIMTSTQALLMRLDMLTLPAIPPSVSCMCMWGERLCCASRRKGNGWA